MMEEKTSNIMFAFMAIMAILIVVFKNDMSAVVIILAVGLLGGGIGYLVEKKPAGYLMLGVGLSVGVGIALYRTGVLNIYDTFTFVFASTIALSMILALIIETIRKKQILNTHTLIVEAELIDLVRNVNVKKEIYLPVYSYKVDKEIYEVNYPKYLTKHLPSIGSTKPLKVNPKNHVDVYFEPEMKDKAIYVACALFLSIASIAVIVSLFI